MPKKLENEKELLAGIASGSARAFTVIFDFYHAKIYSFCLPILRSEQLAQDVVQEVLLKLWRMKSQATTILNLDNYLKVSARNRAIDVLRHQQVREKLLGEHVRDWSGLSNETEEQVLLSDARRLLDEAVLRLPPQQKMVYQLIIESGMKNAEVAAQLDLSVDTVKTHLKLGRKALREHLAKHMDSVAIFIIFNLL